MAPSLWTDADGKILCDETGKPWFCEECPCCPDEPPEEGCDFCAEGTTPLVYEVTFSGVADGSCAGSAAYYNSTTFRFIRHETDLCRYEAEGGSLGGPCGIGPADIVIGSTLIVMTITNPTPAILRTPHISGGSCDGPIGLAFFSQAGGPPPTLDFSLASATIIEE